MNLHLKKLARKNSTIARTLSAQVTTSLLILVQGLLLIPAASAETLARAQGRCKFTAQSGAQTFTVFDGHCTVKQKQQGNTTIFVVDLDNGSEYRFFGANRQALQIETPEGVHNAQFAETAEKGVFSWQADGNNNRLSVKLDTQHNVNVSHDDPQPTSVGTSVGAAVGALIGALLTGGKSPASTQSSAPITPAKQTNIGLVSRPVEDLRDLVGARAGQAENTVKQRGYQFVRSEDDVAESRVFGFWRQPNSGLCVTIITKEGRYNTIVYANVRNQTTCK